MSDVTIYTTVEKKCRVYKHAWDDDATPIGVKPAPPGTVRVSLRCERCTSWRHDYVDRNGDVIRRYYDYAPGYLKEKGSGKPTTAELRAQLLARKLANVRSTRKAPLKAVKKTNNKRKVMA